MEQLINITLDNEEAKRILDDIDIAYLEMQQDLGGESTSESTTTAELDHATLSQSLESPYI
jgi:hypothetical protein